ncbi:unnamed protein product [Diamesa hyperborea]
MTANDSVGDLVQEFDVFRCMAYELTILRYTYNVIEANLVQFMIDYPEDTCVGIKQALDPLYRVLKRLVSRSFGDVSIEQSFGVPPKHSTPVKSKAISQGSTRTEMRNQTQHSNFNVPFVTVTPPPNPYNSVAEQQFQSNKTYQMSAEQNRTQFVPNQTYNTNLKVPGQIINRTMPAQRGNLNQTLPVQSQYPDRTMPVHSTSLNRTMPVQSHNPSLTIPVDVDLGVTLPGLQPSLNRTYIAQGNLNRTLPGPNRSKMATPVTNQPSYTILRPGTKKPRWRRNDRQS